MFVVNGGSESGVVYTDRNVEKCNGRIRNRTKEFAGRMEGELNDK